MTRWFASLPIHRKLIVMALAATTAALTAAVSGLLAFDIARFQGAAIDDAEALAQVIARNSAAAIVFNDAEAAQQIVDSVGARPVVSRACTYGSDGKLLAGYQRSPASPCPAVPAERRGWRAVARTVPVSRNGRVVGKVYVERLLSDLPGRVIVTATAAFLMLLGAAALAFGLARRMQQVISRPIVALASAARSIGRDQVKMPAIPAPPDETGELVRAFSDMVQRLVSANEALQMEVEERRRMQAEREQLLAREREASRLKDEFLAAVSHELRTPLNAILGWAQILEKTPHNEQIMAKAISSVSRNARAQSRVIEDLLDVSRIVTGKLQLTLATIDLRMPLQSAVDIVAPMALAKRIHFDVDLPTTACLVEADSDRLRQVFWNLISNAVKFTPAAGSVKVTMAARGDTVITSIIDTGVGIAPSFLPHVFERFRQADGSTTREHGGLGLGLAIVKELTELHHGSVVAASSGQGQGATFTVTFSRLAGSTRDAPAPVSPSASAVRLDGVDVVAIDDNPDTLDILTSTLSHVGARVRTAQSAAEALDQIRHARPDIVLCDLAMPTMDGFEVLRLIRRSETAMSPMPVLAVTAYASEEYRERCRRAGFQGHLAKPYDTEELLREVNAALTRPS